MFAAWLLKLCGYPRAGTQVGTEFPGGCHEELAKAIVKISQRAPTRRVKSSHAGS
jgi:hypothetical protein